MSITSSLSHLSLEKRKHKDILKEIPEPLQFLVAYFLTPFEIPKISLVCKEWQKISKNIFYDLCSKKMGCRSDELSARIQDLKQIVISNRESLSRIVQKADMKNGLVVGIYQYSYSYSQKIEKDFQTEKSQITQKIEKLFHALMDLRRVRLVEWSQIEEVANVLLFRCELPGYWAKIALGKLADGDVDGAKKIILGDACSCYEGTKVATEIIIHYTKNNQLLSAFEFYCEVFPLGENTFSNRPLFDRATETIIEESLQSQNFAIYEQMYDKVPTKKKTLILRLINHLIVLGNFTEADRKVKEYQGYLECLYGDYKPTIDIYIKLNYYIRAIDFAKKAVDSNLEDPFTHKKLYGDALKYLLEAFKQKGLSTEATKVKQCIDALDAEKVKSVSPSLV
jgi:hypothetical protein